MRQQINLVNPALLPPKPFFQFSSLVISLAVISLALGVFAVMLGDRLSVYQSAAELAQQRVTVKQEQVNAFESRLSLRTRDPVVAADLLKAQEERQHLQRIALSLQQGGSNTENRSYANYLYALAQKPSPGVWLTQIEFHGATMSLRGMVLDAAAIPAYLAQLRSTPGFAGQRFASFELGRKQVGEGVEALMFRLDAAPEEKRAP